MRTRHTLLLAGATALLVFAGACYDDEPTAPDNSQATSIYLTDAPFPYDTVEAVEIWIERIDLSTSADTTSIGGQVWVTVATPRRRVDLLDYHNGATLLVGQSTIPAGQYRAARMVIDTDSSRIVARGGAEMPVNWQSSTGRPTLHALVEAALDVPAEGAHIVIDFDVGRSFVRLAPGDPFIFLPWFRAVDRTATGSVQGTVTASLLDGSAVPIENAAVTVYRVYGDEDALFVAATARTDEQGAYTAAFLMPGTYVVSAEAPNGQAVANGRPRFLHDDSRAPVSVARGLATPVSFSLAEVSGASITVEWPRTLAIGDTADLTATVRDEAGAPVANPAVTWLTSNSAVASVTASGHVARVAGVSAGRATITARSGSLADSAVVQVGDSVGTGGGPPATTVASLSITPASLVVAVGDSAAFVVTARDSANVVLTNPGVSWSVSDSTIALIFSPPVGPQYVVVRARKAGTVTVQATAQTKTATATLVVR